MSLLFQSTLRSTVAVGGAAATKRAGYLGVLSSSSFVGDRRRSFGSDADSGPLVKTSLNDLHKELGGDMVPFAGYELPVLYKGTDNGGVMKEHLWCRSEGKASLFDVSHMGQVCS
jgi:aminomethyltransferase